VQYLQQWHSLFPAHLKLALRLPFPLLDPSYKMVYGD
jgi:hypothetical protein